MSEPENVPWWKALPGRARTQWSQGGEEGVIEAIFEAVGETNRHAVDIGAGDGFHLSNTRFLAERGWTVAMFDAICAAGVIRSFITADIVEALLEAAGVPPEPDFLSLDLDGVDYWIWKAIQRRPRVVLVEFNGAIPPDRAITVPYDEQFRFDGTSYYGASFSAMVALGAAKGYAPVCQLHSQNLFFVREDCLPPGEKPVVTYKPIDYHPLCSPWRRWVEVG